MKMSNLCKRTMTREFNFTDDELLAIERFMNNMNMKTAKEILRELTDNDNLDIKQKIVIAYIIGNIVGEITNKSIGTASFNFSSQSPRSYGG